MTTSWIQTYSHGRLSLLDPDPELIQLRDIAVGLCGIRRWGGQTAPYFSVAAHSMAVAELLQRHLHSHQVEYKREYMLQALLHDAPETYIGGDVRGPVKALCRDLLTVEERIWQAICQKFQISPLLHPLVIQMDRLMAATEVVWICNGPVQNWIAGLPAPEPTDELIAKFARVDEFDFTAAVEKWL